MPQQSPGDSLQCFPRFVASQLSAWRSRRRTSSRGFLGTAKPLVLLSIARRSAFADIAETLRRMPALELVIPPSVLCGPYSGSFPSSSLHPRWILLTSSTDAVFPLATHYQLRQDPNVLCCSLKKNCPVADTQIRAVLWEEGKAGEGQARGLRRFSWCAHRSGSGE